jgi:hypothetical protein
MRHPVAFRGPSFSQRIGVVPPPGRTRAHETVNHSQGEYAPGDIHTNTAESGFALIKRGLMGIHHAASKRHLHRYVAHYDFLWDVQKMNDGQRTIAAHRASEGKRLPYKTPLATELLT